MIQIYDTMTRSLRTFSPIEKDKVKMYVCGPTVYNYIHIGNARSLVVFDTIRRYFEYRGYHVQYVSNFTDVDDKIIKAAAKEGVTTKELAEKFIVAFNEDARKLGIKPATRHPKVSNYITQIIDFIRDLIGKGFAYESSGDVYFRVNLARNYVRMCNNPLKGLKIGSSGRIGSEIRRKEHPVDFVLWKSAKFGEVSWASPWGQGRPGWHIGCSVMATEILGDTIDIHGGGIDLEFPHHTNEIFQSESKTEKPFVNYWMHNAMLNMDNEKMSKSGGKFVTVRDLLGKVNGNVLRLFLVNQHYRHPVHLTDQAIRDAEINLRYLKNSYEQTFTGTKNVAEFDELLEKFQSVMDKDFNTANGITVVFEIAKWINSGHYNSVIKKKFAALLAIFGIVFREEILDHEIKDLIEERQNARANADFLTADRIRDQLAEHGIYLLDTRSGVRWIRDGY